MFHCLCYYRCPIFPLHPLHPTIWSLMSCKRPHSSDALQYVISSPHLLFSSSLLWTVLQWLFIYLYLLCLLNYFLYDKFLEGKLLVEGQYVVLGIWAILPNDTKWIFSTQLDTIPAAGQRCGSPVLATMALGMGDHDQERSLEEGQRIQGAWHELKCVRESTH